MATQQLWAPVSPDPAPEVPAPVSIPPAWDPVEQPGDFNPWYDVSGLTRPPSASTAASRPSPGGGLTFLSLPADVVLLFCRELDRMDLVSLARTCRDLAALLPAGGMSTELADKKDAWELLLRRERDDDDDDSNLAAACQRCMRLHRPTGGVSSEDDDDETGEPYHPCLADGCTSFLPRRASPAFVRLLARARLQGLEGEERDIAATMRWTQTHILPDVKIANTVTFRWVDTSLLLKNETVIAPLVYGDDGTPQSTPRGAYLLNEVLYGAFSHGDICQHFDWELMGWGCVRHRNRGATSPRPTGSSASTTTLPLPRGGSPRRTQTPPGDVPPRQRQTQTQTRTRTRKQMTTTSSSTTKKPSV